MTIGQKLLQINWMFVLLTSLTASVGFLMLYSASNGSMNPWATRQIIRFFIGLTLMLTVAVVDIRVWLKYAYVIYLIAIGLLLVVEFGGIIGMGAQRWINFGIFNVQPSEIMKVAIILAIARYFYARRLEYVNSFIHISMPLVLIIFPALLILRQPDLGTTILLVATGLTMLFLVGVKLWFFAVGLVLSIIACY
ncbi:MAG: FtsW/RodA/SpoVE family cell cycle protein, partial [Rhodospirillaceae bacterium]|nr:FtsW/RodA/SpoVE family cell cycle protein [Rhodospirillaceae bacterium]